MTEASPPAGRAFVEAMSRTDIAGQWREIIASIDNDSTAMECDNSIMACTMIEDYFAGSSNKSEDTLPMSKKIKRYYAQFGLKLTIIRVFEKLAGK